MIEEEREEDERKLNVAIAAAERMNIMVSGRNEQMFSLSHNSLFMYSYFHMSVKHRSC